MYSIEESSLCLFSDLLIHAFVIVPILPPPPS